MKLTVKLVFTFFVAVLVLVGASGYLAVQREIALFEEEMKASHRRIGSAVEPLVLDIWRTTGRGGVIEIISSIKDTEQRVRIRWVWLNGISRDDPCAPHASPDQLTEVGPGSPVYLKSQDADGRRMFRTYYHIDVAEPLRGALELSESLERSDQYTRDTIFRTVGFMAALTLLTGLLMAVVGVRLVGRPLAMLTEKLRRAGQGDLSGPVQLTGNDELSELAGALNQMCDLLAASQQAVQDEASERLVALEQLRHADRLRTVGRLASGVAHELGTPLNVVSGRASLIESGRLSDVEIIDSARVIKSESERMTGIIRQLLDFARRSTPRRATVDMRKVAELTMSLLEPLAKKRDATLTLSEGDGQEFAVSADSGQMQQVLSNLIVNALQSKPEGVRVEIGIRKEYVAQPPDGVEAAAGDYVCVFVRDTGSGISEADLPHVFEPFFTRRDVGEGTGLGLSIAHGILTEHGGWIDVISAVGHGSCFSAYLPLEGKPDS